MRMTQSSTEKLVIYSRSQQQKAMCAFSSTQLELVRRKQLWNFRTIKHLCVIKHVLLLGCKNKCVSHSMMCFLEELNKETMLVSIFKNDRERQLATRKTRRQMIFQHISSHCKTRATKCTVESAGMPTLKVLLQTIVKLSLCN